MATILCNLPLMFENFILYGGREPVDGAAFIV